MNGDETRRLAISSAEPGDGKTTVSSNLAIAFHQAGKRVLLIDGDIRKPGLTKLVGFRASPGVSDILRGTRPVAEMAAEFVQRSGSVPIDIIPSGRRPSNPAELLLSDRFAELLSWGETVYDQVIVDAPPALAGTDAAAIGRACDGLMMVIRPEKNRRRVIVQAVDVFRKLGTKLLGAVINGVGVDTDAYGYGYGYGYGTAYGEEERETDLVADDIDGADADAVDDAETLPHPSLRRSAA
jgi:Mrp family chromosome partitioning ATPase